VVCAGWNKHSDNCAPRVGALGCALESGEAVVVGGSYEELKTSAYHPAGTKVEPYLQSRNDAEVYSTHTREWTLVNYGPHVQVPSFVRPSINTPRGVFSDCGGFFVPGEEQDFFYSIQDEKYYKVPTKFDATHPCTRRYFKHRHCFNHDSDNIMTETVVALGGGSSMMRSKGLAELYGCDVESSDADAA
jgi:hypothetical protein